jgi:protein-S-isoprenylcysteine O-methyltransferase Ste14
MLQNWIIGPAFLVSAIPFYLHRVRREEMMLINKFGSEYLDYMKHTGEVIPKPAKVVLLLPTKFPRIFGKKSKET